MSLLLCAVLLLLSVLASLYFSALTYALRDFSHSKLADYLGKHDGDKWYETLTEKTEQYVLVTAVCRMAASLLIWVSIFGLLNGQSPVAWYSETVFLAAIITLTSSIVIPHALAKYMAEPIIGISAPLLSAILILFAPVTLTTRVFDDAVKRALGVRDDAEQEEIEQEIMSVVEEGEKEGVVDEQERELIENVIEFRDATAGHIMTARTDVVALEVTAPLEEVRATFESSGNSRLPVYEENLDKIIGILHGRDLIKLLGRDQKDFDLRSVLRPAMFVPETKPLRHLLNDFRNYKTQMAIVLDEYGGVTGLVTIEDVLEELVGEIVDEHEPSEPAMFKKLPDGSAEADARLPVSELNHNMGLNIPEDAGFETLGGFLMNCLGRIPEKGACHDVEGYKFTVIDAAPNRINRVRIEALAAAAAKPARI
jgi:CBS domain containing-hemolysin-like protein